MKGSISRFDFLFNSCQSCKMYPWTSNTLFHYKSKGITTFCKIWYRALYHASNGLVVMEIHSCFVRPKPYALSVLKMFSLACDKHFPLIIRMGTQLLHLWPWNNALSKTLQAIKSDSRHQKMKEFEKILQLKFEYFQMLILILKKVDFWLQFKLKKWPVSIWMKKVWFFQGHFLSVALVLQLSYFLGPISVQKRQKVTLPSTTKKL